MRIRKRSSASLVVRQTGQASVSMTIVRLFSAADDEALADDALGVSEGAVGGPDPRYGVKVDTIVDMDGMDEMPLICIDQLSALR